MVKQEDILKMLQEGADAGELAQQFADALNAAIAEKNAQATQKVAKMQAIIDESFDFIELGLENCFVKTSFTDGLLPEHVEKAVSILNGCKS